MNLKTCEGCGKEISEEAKFCQYCGKQNNVAQEENPITFPENEANSKEKKKKHILSWIVCIFMFLSALAVTPYSLANIFMFCCSLIACPLFFKYINLKYNNKLKTGMRVILCIACFVFALICTPTSWDSTNNLNTSTNTNTNSITNSSNSSNATTENKKEPVTKKTVDVVDFKIMPKSKANKWCEDNNVDCKMVEEYSTTVAKGKYVKQSIAAGNKIYEGDNITITYSLGKKPTNEEKNALRKAETYSNMLHMSKQAIYDQLISEYGEGFTKEAAQYAINNLKADWNANALAKAKTYQQQLSMSKKAIYDQLISPYGEKFTKSQAQYAIDHLED